MLSLSYDFWSLCLIAFQISALTRFIRAGTLCRECVPADLVFSPGIGFDLTLEYGTAALRNYDGSISIVGKVEGDKEYRALMLQFLNEADLEPEAERKAPLLQHTMTPYYDRSMTSDSKDQGLLFELLLRIVQAMKNAIDYVADKKHHPVDSVPCKPTPEMETFMTMFKRLQEMTEHHLQRSLNSSGISVPNFFNHRHKVLAIEAAECTGFRVVLPEWWLDNSAATAGIAATGIGMCEHYRSMARYVSERGVMSPENVLVVDYSQAALGAALVKVRHGTYERNPSYFTDVDMGAVSPWRSDQGEAAYWNQIKARLQDLPKRAKIMPTRLIFMGDSVSDKTFLNVLRDALMELSGQSFEDQIAPIDFNQAVVDWLVQMETADPLFRAAIGAAELAKRSMESPGGCMESTSCYEEKGEKKDTS